MSDAKPCPPGRDLLDVACERIWFEIRALLPRYRYLRELGVARSVEHAHELTHLATRLARLRARSNRYRDVLRSEAWAKYFDETPL